MNSYHNDTYNLGKFNLSWYIDSKSIDHGIRTHDILPGINLPGFSAKKLPATTPNFNQLFKKYCDLAFLIMKLPINLDEYYDNYSGQWTNDLISKRTDLIY
jgi:hypothetical protein